MKTIGDLAEAFAKLERYARTIEEGNQELERPMFPDARALLEAKVVAAQEAHQALYDQQLLPDATPARRAAPL